jgi:AraC-like DNA-binding protein
MIRGMNTSRPDARERFETAGTDPDVAVAMYSAAYGGNEFTASRTDRVFGYRHTAVGDHRMTLCSSRFDGRMTGVLHLRREYVVTWITAGDCRFEVDGVERALAPGVPEMLPTKPYRFDFSDCEQSLVQFEKGFLERVAAERLGVEPGPLAFELGVRPSGERLSVWRRGIGRAANVVLSKEAPTADQLAEASLTAANLLLDTFEHVVGSPNRAIPAGATGRVREAIEFMHDSAQRDISSTDVAERVGMSVRGLQQAFRRQLGAAPNVVLRGIRLDRVNEELRSASPADTTVAEVAVRWGFAHLGRFSGAYMSRFGEYPRETLAR